MTNLEHIKQERGRPTGFSREELIRDVSELFWTHGYNNLSLNIIAQKNDLKRSSLYNSFKTKEALFSECLEYYAARSPARRLHSYKPGQKVGDLLYKIFDEISIIRAKDKQNRGCFAANAYDELAATETNLGEMLRQKHQDRYDRMVRLITCAIKQDELPSNTNAKTIANIILSFMSGLNIHAKKGMKQAEFEDMSTTFLEKIGFVKPIT